MKNLLRDRARKNRRSRGDMEARNLEQSQTDRGQERVLQMRRE